MTAQLRRRDQPPSPAAGKSGCAPPPAASAAAASPVPSTETWLHRLHRPGLSLAHRRRRQLRHLPQYRQSRLGTEADRRRLHHSPIPSIALFDQIRVRASGWGDEPYETFHLDAKKSKLYDFSADYRDIAYFDFLPSYADPLLARGIMLNEQSFDYAPPFGQLPSRSAAGQLVRSVLRLRSRLGLGTGVTTFVTDANEFPVPNTMNDLTNLYRGGVRFELRRFHATLEEGGTTFTNNQNVYQNPGSTNYGNVTTPVFGPDHGSHQPSRGLRRPRDQHLQQGSVHGQRHVLARSLRTVSLQPAQHQRNYQQADTGNLILQSQVLFYTSQQYLVSAAAKLPHTTRKFRRGDPAVPPRAHHRVLAHGPAA